MIEIGRRKNKDDYKELRVRIYDTTEDIDTSGTYVDLKPFLDLNPEYLFVFSGRSDGKTTSAFREGVRRYMETGEQMAIVRRHEQELSGTSADSLFNGLVDLGFISELTDGVWDGVRAWGKRWYFTRYEEHDVVDSNGKVIDTVGKTISAKEPFALGFALSKYREYKSASWGRIGYIVFDEFISDSGYLTREVSALLSLISTIVRDRGNVPVILLGNVLNRYNPYFKAFNIEEAKTMSSGDVYLYDIEEFRKSTKSKSMAKWYVYYSNKNIERGGKDSDKMFAGVIGKDVDMITEGEWKTGEYPKPSEKVTEKKIKWKFYIEFDNQYVEGSVVDGDEGVFLYFRDIFNLPDSVRDGDCALFSMTPSSKINIFYDLYTNHRSLSIIGLLLRRNKAFYSNDITGEIVRNYLLESRNNSVL